MSKREKKYKSAIIEKLLEESDSMEYSRLKNRMLLAAKIDDALKSKGWKKKELAEALGKEPSVITRWLSGTHNFTSDTLTDIGIILEINLFNLEETSGEIVIRFQPLILEQNIKSETKCSDSYNSIIQNGKLSSSNTFQLDSLLS